MPSKKRRDKKRAMRACVCVSECAYGEAPMGRAGARAELAVCAGVRGGSAVGPTCG